MSYGINNSVSRIGLLSKIKKKTGKIIAKRFPLNSVRKWGIHLCGYSVGNKVYIGEEFLIIDAISEKGPYLKIEDRVSIAPRVTIILASDANWSEIMDTRKPIRGTVILKESCWIGTGAIIFPDITIGRKAIVAAGSVVTKSVDDGLIVAGVPARPINTR